jgi:hypothetical protein
MNKHIPALVLALAIAGCSDDGVSPPPPDVAPVLTFDEQASVGSSALTRTSSGISFNLETTQLEPQTAVSVWVVVFNEPQYCETRPCNEPDLFVPAVMADVLGSPGTLVGDGGSATFSGSRLAGDGSVSLLGALGLPSPGIIDPATAEIHFVLRSHGPVIPGREDEMISTFNGGCQHPGSDFPDPLPAQLGAPGPNTCVDVQFSVHEP